MSGETEYSKSKNDAPAIEIKLKKINQLFNSFDPSPFLDKELDDDAVEYIVSYALEYAKLNQKMIIYVPTKHKSKMSEIEIRRSIHNFFEYKRDLAEKRIKLKFREGQLSLVVGISFLVTCILLGKYIGTFAQNTWTYILEEGLLIGGWVAMWKPISDILYEWWPIYDEKKIYHKLSEMPIEFRYV
jgi:hypothetical protein